MENVGSWAEWDPKNRAKNRELALTGERTMENTGVSLPSCYIFIAVLGYFTENLADSSSSIWYPWQQEQLLFTLVFTAHSTEWSHNKH